MKEAHKNVSLVKVADTAFSEDKPAFKYKDYLKEMGRTTKSVNYPSEMVEIRKLLKDPSASQYEKFERAKIIAERMENRKTTSSTDNLVNNINAKI